MERVQVYLQLEAHTRPHFPFLKIMNPHGSHRSYSDITAKASCFCRCKKIGFFFLPCLDEPFSVGVEEESSLCSSGTQSATVYIFCAKWKCFGQGCHISRSGTFMPTVFFNHIMHNFLSQKNAAYYTVLELFCRLNIFFYGGCGGNVLQKLCIAWESLFPSPKEMD